MGAQGALAHGTDSSHLPQPGTSGRKMLLLRWCRWCLPPGAAAERHMGCDEAGGGWGCRWKAEEGEEERGRRSDRWEADGRFGNKSNFQSPGNISPATGSLRKRVGCLPTGTSRGRRGASHSCLTKLAAVLLCHVEGASPWEPPTPSWCQLQEPTYVALGYFCPVRPGIHGFMGKAFWQDWGLNMPMPGSATPSQSHTVPCLPHVPVGLLCLLTPQKRPAMCCMYWSKCSVRPSVGSWNMPRTFSKPRQWGCVEEV